MLWQSWLRMSLARKISLLFGTAVLATIGVTLTFPWLQMTALNEEAMLMQANWVVTTARQTVNLREPDWSRAQQRLAAHWPVLMQRYDLPAQPPQLVRAESVNPGGFRAEAIRRLSDNPNQKYYWKLQDDGRLFRYAMAVRGYDTDVHPASLRGILDLKMPMPRTNSIWNLVVTVLAGASGAVLAILVFYFVTQRLVLSPLLSLRRAAEQVATGNVTVRTEIARGDEFQELSEAFNDMLLHLNTVQEELRKTNRSLDIRLGELAETNVALYESNRLKSEFLTNVTHELRTPLVSIIGFAELLRDAWGDGKVDQKRLSRYSENILISGRSLLEIINDLLDLAKIEAGKMEVHISSFDMGQLGKDLIDFLQPIADKKNQELLWQLNGALPAVTSDSGKVKQILYNLLSNALKFTPAGGKISLAMEARDSEHIQLIVQDTGPGVPPDQAKSIFEKFHQLDASKTREHQGTGLGLTITQELVTVLKGRIHLQPNEGRGATFVVTIPIRLAKEGASEKPPSP